MIGLQKEKGKMTSHPLCFPHLAQFRDDDAS